MLAAHLNIQALLSALNVLRLGQEEHTNHSNEERKDLLINTVKLRCSTFSQVQQNIQLSNG